MLFMPHVCQVCFAKLLIEWYWVDWVFLEQGGFKMVRGENTGPANSTPEEVWEPLIWMFAPITAIIWMFAPITAIIWMFAPIAAIIWMFAPITAIIWMLHQSQPSSECLYQSQPSSECLHQSQPSSECLYQSQQSSECLYQPQPARYIRNLNLFCVSSGAIFCTVEAF